MSFLNTVLKAFVGDKSKKDVKEIQPIVDKVKALESKFEALNLDELRAKTAEFKSKIAEATKEVKEKMAALNTEADETDDITRKEDNHSRLPGALRFR